MEEKNQNIEESNKKDLTQEEIEDVQGGSPKCGAGQMELPPMVEGVEGFCLQ